MVSGVGTKRLGTRRVNSLPRSGTHAYSRPHLSVLKYGLNEMVSVRKTIRSKCFPNRKNNR